VVIQGQALNSLASIQMDENGALELLRQVAHDRLAWYEAADQVSKEASIIEPDSGVASETIGKTELHPRTLVQKTTPQLATESILVQPIDRAGWCQDFLTDSYPRKSGTKKAALSVDLDASVQAQAFMSLVQLMASFNPTTSSQSNLAELPESPKYNELPLSAAAQYQSY
jgi:hypothetical protein